MFATGEMAAIIFAAGVLALIASWRTVVVCYRFNNWLFWVVLVMDHVALIAGSVVGLAVWKLLFFYAASRWDPVRGLFRLPKWPRPAYFRGPGRAGRRVFNEPMPWLRGPTSY